MSGEADTHPRAPTDMPIKQEATTHTPDLSSSSDLQSTSSTSAVLPPPIVLPASVPVSDPALVEVRRAADVDDLAARNGVLEEVLKAMPAGYPFHAAPVHLCQCSAMPGAHTHTMPHLARIPLDITTSIRPLPSNEAGPADATPAGYANLSTEPIAASSSPAVITHTASASRLDVASAAAAGLTPLSTISVEPPTAGVHAGTSVLGPHADAGQASTSSAAVVPQTTPSTGSVAGTVTSSPATAKTLSPTPVVRAGPLAAVTADLLNAEPSPAALANLQALNANLSQNLSVLNSTLANLSQLSPPPPAAPSTSASTGAGSSKSKPAPGSVKKAKKDAPADASCQTVIECGELLPSGKRVMTEWVDFFGKEVEIYTAAIDPERRHLYRASALAEKFGYATNKVGMYLARRRSALSGIYQATSFKNKPPGRTGLKAGGYFISISGCREFEHHFRSHDEMLGGMPVSTVPSSSTTRAKHQSARAERKEAAEDEEADEEERHPTGHEGEDDGLSPNTRAARGARPALGKQAASGSSSAAVKLRISSSEAEASANLAMLAQCTPDAYQPSDQPSGSASKPPMGLNGKKRSADAAQLNAFPPTRRVLEVNTAKRASIGPIPHPVLRKPMLPLVPHVQIIKSERAGGLDAPGYHPGLSPLSPLTETSPMPGLESEAGVPALQAVTAQGGGKSAFEPMLKKESGEAAGGGLVVSAANKAELLAQQQAQHYQYQAHLQSQQAHFQAMANQHVLGSPPGRNLYPYSGTPQFGTSYPPLASPFNAGGYTPAGAKPMAISLPNMTTPGGPSTTPSLGGTSFMTNHTPFGMMNSPMGGFSPFPAGMMQLSTPSGFFPPGMQPASTPMQPVVVNHITYINPGGGPLGTVSTMSPLPPGMPGSNMINGHGQFAGGLMSPFHPQAMPMQPGMGFSSMIAGSPGGMQQAHGMHLSPTGATMPPQPAAVTIRSPQPISPAVAMHQGGNTPPVAAAAAEAQPAVAATTDAAPHDALATASAPAVAAH